MKNLSNAEAAMIGRAFGNPNRLSIFVQIAQHEELFCGEMQAKGKISPSTLSHHLKVLTEAGLITSRKEGLNVFYKSVPERSAAFQQYLRNLTPR